MDSTTDNNETWKNLLEWIQASQGGRVCPHLELFFLDHNHNHRGVRATCDLDVGTVLMELPSTLALDGRSMPAQYECAAPIAVDESTTTTRHVSPWLQCLAALLQQKRETGKSPFQAYFKTLPETYETLWEWKDEELQVLQGTCPPAGAAGGAEWKVDRAALCERYQTHIRPYLAAQGIVVKEEVEAASQQQTNKEGIDREMQAFSWACQTISTRGFHLFQQESNAEDPSVTTKTDDNDYSGPYLLPLIDLINHADTAEKKVTTLQRTANNSFVMVAEKPIVAGQEILHSYGSDLTAAQFLQTFGFCPAATMKRAARATFDDDDDDDDNTVCAYPVTPAVLSKQSILEACWDVMESGLPSQLADSMREQELEDEVWSVAVDRSRTMENTIGDDLLVSYNHVLSDELVTLASVPFMPVCAYREAARTLVDASLLQDYYLGKLVGSALLRVVRTKLASYPATTVYKEVDWEDAKLLQELLQELLQDSATTDPSKLRLAYALTIRLEEKASMAALARRVMDVLTCLDDDVEASDDAKRPRMAIE